MVGLWATQKLRVRLRIESLDQRKLYHRVICPELIRRRTVIKRYQLSRHNHKKCLASTVIVEKHSQMRTIRYKKTTGTSWLICDRLHSNKCCWHAIVTLNIAWHTRKNSDPFLYELICNGKVLICSCNSALNVTLKTWLSCPWPGTA